MLACQPSIAQSREAAGRAGPGKPKLALVAGGWGVLKGEMNWDRDGEWDTWIPGGLWKWVKRLEYPDCGLTSCSQPSSIPKQSKDTHKSFTFDYSYWSHTSVRLLGWGKQQ